MKVKKSKKKAYIFGDEKDATRVNELAKYWINWNVGVEKKMSQSTKEVSKI
jgi:hypothetical protein